MRTASCAALTFAVVAGGFTLACAATAASNLAGTGHASYTTPQAERGRLQYYESCAECHGGKLDGQFGPALAGPDDNLKYQTVADVYTYFSTHMPHGNPESLTHDQYLAIMAFIMQAHGIAAGPRPLTLGTVARDTAVLGGP